MGFVSCEALLWDRSQMKSEGSKEMMWLIIAIAVYLLLQIVILPYFGVETGLSGVCGVRARHEQNSEQQAAPHRDSAARAGVSNSPLTQMLSEGDEVGSV